MIKFYTKILRSEQDIKNPDLDHFSITFAPRKEEERNFQLILICPIRGNRLTSIFFSRMSAG